MMKVHIEQDIPMGGLRVYLWEEDHNGRRSFVEPFNLTLKTVEPGTPVEPTLRLDNYIAQSFGDALIAALEKAGFVSPENSKAKDKALQDAATLTATKAHLEDMRRLVFEDKPHVQITGSM